MLNYDQITKKPTLFKSITGLEIKEFDTIYHKINTNYKEHEKQRLKKENRKHKIGAGHPFKLSLQNRLLMFLIYYRLYITSTLTGFLFDLDQSNVLKDIHKLEPQLKDTLPTPKKIHNKIKRLQTIEEIQAILPGLNAFIDATEQEIPRPKNKHKRKTHYSGKKKKHTVKTQLTVNANGLIVHKSAHVSGSVHDYRLFKHSHPCLPKQVRRKGDLGYKGVAEDFPLLDFVVPFKRKSPGRGKRGVKAESLLPQQKAFNKELASERVISEHTNSRVKKFQVWGSEFRNRLRYYDVMTEIVSGIINFRIVGTLAI